MIISSHSTQKTLKHNMAGKRQERRLDQRCTGSQQWLGPWRQQGLYTLLKMQ